jgi:hypothetical protein
MTLFVNKRETGTDLHHKNNKPDRQGNIGYKKTG